MNLAATEVEQVSSSSILINALTPSELRVARKNKIIDELIKYILLIAATFSIVIVIVQIGFLLYKAAPAIPEVNFVSDNWDPTQGEGEFGLKALIYGSVAVTVGAMIFAIPTGIAIAIFISEIAPLKFKTLLKGIIEILSGIPSVVYGYFGLTYLVPLIEKISPNNYGDSLLAGSILLAIMALPTIISVSEDALSVVPKTYREASLGIGATKWQTISKVVVPSASSGITTAIILGMGRAIGETMAVLMVTGNNDNIPVPITDVWSRIRTLTATLAIEIPETPQYEIYFNHLFFLVILLFGIIIILNLSAEIILSRLKRKFQAEYVAKNAAASKSKFQKFFQKYKSNFFAVSLHILIYLVLQTWVRWYTAFFILAGLEIFLLLYKSLDPKTEQKISFTVIFLTFLVLFLILMLMIGIIVFNAFKYNSTWSDWIRILTEIPGKNATEGGIMPAIFGTLYLTFGSIIIAVPLGILAGIYLAEYAKDNWLTRLIRVAIDNLNGTPSIVFGLFGFTIFILIPVQVINNNPNGILAKIYLLFFNTNSTGNIVITKALMWGILTLALMILPTIIRTTEEAVRSVNQVIKEGSLALGATKWYTIQRVILPTAAPGVITGIILGMGRSSGETAPIMFTAVRSNANFAGIPNPLSNMFAPIMVLSYQLYYTAQHVPNSDAIQHAIAFILLIMVLFIYGGAMLIRNKIRGNNKSSFHY